MIAGQTTLECGTNIEGGAPSPCARRWGWVLLALIFLTGIFDHGLWGPNDAREGTMIWEMFHFDRWVSPVLNGEPYLEKPPLLHWVALGFCHAWRSAPEGFLRLPAALCGFGAAAFAVGFGRRLGRERAGWAAAFMCATAAQFAEYSRVVLTDTCVAFCVCACLMLFWRAWSSPPPRAGKWTAFLLATALTFYAKGFVGPALVWAGCGLFLLWRRRWGLVLALPAAYLVLQVLLLLPWAWALWRDGGMAQLQSALWDNQFGRFFVFGTPEDHPELPIDPYFVHKEDIFYYLRTLPGTLMPWTLLVAGGLWNACRRGRGPDGECGVFLRFALGGMLLLLHVSSAKVANYMLPAYPLFMLFAMVWLQQRLPVAAPKSAVRWMAGLTLAICALAGLVLPLVTGLGVFWPHKGFSAIQTLGPFRAAVALGLSSALLVGTGILLHRGVRCWRSGRDGALQVMSLLPVCAAIGLCVGVWAGFPVYDAHRSPAAFGRFLRTEQAAGRRIWLAPMAEKHAGACVYYAQSRFSVLPLDATGLAAFRAATREGPVGLVMTRNNWNREAAAAGFDKGFHAVSAPGLLNYASARFCLVIPDEPVP